MKGGMNFYHIQSARSGGTDYREVYKNAHAAYVRIQMRSKRRPYLKSHYFKRDKVFLAIFWQHIHEKHASERLRRLRFYACALELLERSPHAPHTKQNPDNRSELLHRFGGIDRGGAIFFVQVKEDVVTHKKWFISVFPEK